MEYVFVGGKTNSKPDYCLPSVKQSKNMLISLIEVLSKTSYPFRSFFQDIQKMHQNYGEYSNFKSFIDSGGYSIIVGDVPGKQVYEFIEYYHMSADFGSKIYDYIFSLDIPIFLGQPENNTKVKIEQYNRRSIEKTIELCAKNEDFRNKLYFVWHFKIRDQYEIWKKLYKEYNLNNIIKYRALGGMVGLRGITQIDFSPFIGPAFRLLLDYINGDTSVPFQMHCLGIYIRHDRFFLHIIEKLFNRYLGRTDCHVTYDSVNYMRTAQFKVKGLDINEFDGQKIIIHPHIAVPDHVLHNVYFTNELYDTILSEIENVKCGNNLNNVDAFTPLNVYSNVQLDSFFEYIIDKYGIIDSFFNGTHNKVISSFLDQIGSIHPNIFTPHLVRSIRLNFRIIWEFHRWFQTNRSEIELDNLMDKFIANIQFPAHLEDVAPLQTLNTKNDIYYKNYLEYTGDQNGS